MIRATVMGISRSSFFSQKRQHPRQFHCLVEIARQLGAAHESNRSCSKQQGEEAASTPRSIIVAVAEIYFLSSLILSTASETLSLAF